MTHLGLTSDPEDLEIKVYPSTFWKGERALVVEGIARGYPVAVHLAFHPEAADGPVEVYFDEDQAFISGVLPTNKHSALASGIVANEKITLCVLDPTIAYAGGGRTSQVTLKAPTDKPLGKAAKKVTA